MTPVEESAYSARYVLGAGSRVVDLVCESTDPLDRVAVEVLADAIDAIGGKRPSVRSTASSSPRRAVLVGTLDRSPAIRKILDEDLILISDPSRAFPGPQDHIIRQRLHKRIGPKPLSMAVLKASQASRYVLFAADLGDEGYVLYHSPKRNLLVVAGATGCATVYGAYKLRDCLYRENGEVVASGFGGPLLPLSSRPLFAHRAVCGQTSGYDAILPGQWEKEWGTDDGCNYRGFIDFLVEHGINTYVNWNFMDQLILGLPYRSDRFPQAVNPFHPNVKHEFFGDMLDYAHQRNIKTIILLNFPDRWHGLIRCHPEIAAANCPLEDFPDEGTWREWQRENRSPAFAGCVCAAKPETRQVFHDYVSDILERYPQIDGIGGQFGESLSETCDCPACRDRFFDLQHEYFVDMVDLARKGRPDRLAYAYRSPGAAETLKRRDDMSGLFWVDWGTAYANYVAGRSRVRGSWYLHHCSNESWNEYGLRAMTRICAEVGLEGFEKRGVSTRELAHDYLAFREFTWSARSGLRELARLWTIKTFREADQDVTDAYTHWMIARGALQMGDFCRTYVELAAWSDERQLAARAERHLELCREALRRVAREHPWIEGLREDVGAAGPAGGD